VSVLLDFYHNEEFMQKHSYTLVKQMNKITFYCLFTSIISGIANINSTYAFGDVNDIYSVDLLRKGPLLLGTAVDEGMLRSTTEPQYRETVKRNFNLVVPNFEMKFDALHRDGRYKYNFTPADNIVDFAVSNNMKVRGHTLIWEPVPNWVKQGNFSSAELQTIMEEHITTVINHFKTKYPGVIIAWDVVNEAYNLNRQYLEEQEKLKAEGLDPNDPRNIKAGRPIWSKIGQYDANGNPNPNWDPLKDYVRVAFRAAKAADPNVKLFYNDYANEGMGGLSDEIFQFVKELKEEGLPIEGVGLQFHVGLKAQNKLADFEANMKRYSDLGLEIQVTELDVGIPVKDPGIGYEPADPEDLNRQANIYGDISTACARNPFCTAILTWGFTYRYSWIPGFFKGSGAATPFDENYEPTPAWIRMKSIVDSANEVNKFKCSVTVQAGPGWKTSTGFANWLLFFVKTTGTLGADVPWTFRVTNPSFKSVSSTWNWTIKANSKGKLRGVADRSWQKLNPNGSNSIPLGMVVNSSQNNFSPTRISLNGVLCTVN
jgi:endo-1,4-beta-xylanase